MKKLVITMIAFAGVAFAPASFAASDAQMTADSGQSNIQTLTSGRFGGFFRSGGSGYNYLFSAPVSYGGALGGGRLSDIFFQATDVDGCLNEENDCNNRPPLDEEIPPVPVPAAVWLFASGLTLLAIRRRRSA